MYVLLVVRLIDKCYVQFDEPVGNGVMLIRYQIPQPTSVLRTVHLLWGAFTTDFEFLVGEWCIPVSDDRVQSSNVNILLITISGV